MKRIRITRGSLGFEREPFLQPFGFKGGYANEVWNSAVVFESDTGKTGIGLAIQSVLWSDAGVFSAYSAAGSNAVMLLLTEFAVNRLRGREFTTPLEVLDELFPEVYRYGCMVTGMDKLRETFALNALVPVDMALWRLYAAENEFASFDDLVPDSCGKALAARHEKLASIPLITYGLSLGQIRALAEGGQFLMKIKVGSDPDADGNREKMLAWDKARLSAIHDALKEYTTPYTDNGRIPYYLDANGRYDTRERLLRFLDHADHIGALERIVLFEEPFPEETRIDVSDIPVRLAADESAHNVEDAKRLIALGYRAMALKPIAKTMSRTFRILETAFAAGVPCFCADLTVNPLMVEWNKSMAARLEALPGIKTGIIESNGNQNYVNWEKMLTWHPCGGKKWAVPQKGIYLLDDEFYAESGGIFRPAPHYEQVAWGR
jgi:L-alanine-DL-glutamate epimerase-like enolase superfamily enzyme